MKTIQFFLFFLSISFNVFAQNTDPLSYHTSHQISDSSYSLKKVNGDSTIFLFEGSSSPNSYRTMSINADSTQVIWQGGSQPADTLEIWGSEATADSGTTAGSGGNYHLPFNGDSTNYLGGDTAYHTLPNSWDLTGNSNATATSFMGPTGNYPLRFKSFSGTNSGFTGGGYSTAFGYDTYSYDTSALYSYSMNTAFGATALHSLKRSTSTSNFGNVAIGFAALSNTKAGTNNIAVGSYALLGSGVLNDKIFKSNIGIGSVALASLTNGIGNIAIGDSSFKNLASGNYNIGLGTKVAWNLTALSPYPNNFFYISDSTYHLHMKLDSATGSAPNVIGKDGNGNWHVYSNPAVFGESYQLPYDGNSTDYLGGDTAYHALPTIYKKAGTDSIFKVINGVTIWVTNSIDVSKPYVWTGSQTFANSFNAIGPTGSANSTLRINGYGGSSNSNWGTTWQILSTGTDIDLGTYTPHAYIHLGQWGGINFKKVSVPLVGGDLGFDQITLSLGLAPEPGAILDVQSWGNHRSLPPFRFRYSNSDQWRDTLVSGALEPYKDSLYFTGQNLIKKRLAFANEPGTPTIISGTSAPASTPSKVGDIYVDITNKKLYFAAGNSSSADWIIAN